jgi:hypothetical protein
VAREVVRDDQWQEFMDVYVRDKHRLGLKDWFEQHNPHALAQSIERMLEAARLEQWDADPRSVAELKAALQRPGAAPPGAQRQRRRSGYSSQPGYGLAAAAPAPACAAPRAGTAPVAPADAPATTATARPVVQGLKLERRGPPRQPLPAGRRCPGRPVLLALALAGGAWRGWRAFGPARARVQGLRLASRLTDANVCHIVVPHIHQEPPCPQPSSPPCTRWRSCSCCPRCVLIAALFLYAFWVLGGFAMLALRRRQGAGRPLVAAHPPVGRPDRRRARPAAHRLMEGPRIASRVTPLLGLVATMIPMGPALKGLSDGNLAQVSANLTVAFSAVILALIAAAITFWVANVRRRWLAEEMLEITRHQRSIQRRRHAVATRVPPPGARLGARGAA